MKRKFSNNSFLGFLIGLMILSSQIFGQQSDFFTTTTIPQGLSQGRLQFINNLSQDSTTKSIDYVLFQDLAQQLAPDGTFSLKVLTEQNRFELTPVHYELQANGDYTWMGKMANDEGYAGFIKISGYLAGFVQSQDAFWEIVPIEAGASIVREMDISKYQKENCGIDYILQEYTPAEVQEMMEGLCDEYPGCGGTIDVLVLVPPDVTQWYGDLNNQFLALIHSAISFFSFQWALINSGVDDISLRFRTASFDFQYSAPLDLFTDVNTTLPNTATNLRQQYRADLVILLTSMDYPGARGASKSGKLVNGQFTYEAPCFDCAYVISEVQNNLNPTWTIAHEIAHLFGTQHNRSNNVPCNDDCGDDEDICTHGWRFDDEGMDRTIMALLFDETIDGGSQRALHFSNPDVQFNNFDTGTPKDNNTLGIENAACLVKDYYASPELGVTFSGFFGLCNQAGTVVPKTYTANVTEPATGFPGGPPYTYEWRWNRDGNFTPSSPGILIGTGSSVTVNAAYWCPNFFLRVTVRASDGTTAHATRVVSTEYCTGCPELNLLIGGGGFPGPVASGKNLVSIEDWDTGNNHYTIAPNPATDNLAITRLNGDGTLFTVRVLDTTGKQLLEAKGQGSGQLEIDLTKCPAGMIWVLIQDERGVSFEKVVKAN